MNICTSREIPYNFTSATDQLIIRQLFGEAVWDNVEELRKQRVTGRSARLLMRFIGDVFILSRNPFLRQELIDSPRRRRYLFKAMLADLDVIEKTARKNSEDETCKAKVLHLLKLCRNEAGKLWTGLNQAKKRRALLTRKLGAIIGRDNVCLDPFSIISHATDATDWRLFLPEAVLFPTKETQIAPLIETLAALGLAIIPRGGGTGLTGGAVPVAPGCVIINTEKLNHIVGIHETRAANGETEPFSVLELEAGVITQNAMDYARERGYVFATDPTSAWASTIGGNLSENAGGKTAVLWGTAIDNVISYKIAMPGAGLLTVRRDKHPMRKILPDDQVAFSVQDQTGKLLRTVSLRGDEIRKKGLWKDITNKALGGLPGLQKEGTDGVITSAEFIVYKKYPRKLTFCLEFFGDSMDEASLVIADIAALFVNRGEETLMALEHFDAEYIRAINYQVKAARSATPKAVLLIDMVAHTPEQIERGRGNLLELLKKYPNTEIFVAADSAEAERFWRDRKSLGAIAARTNAFKLNEDIVLPLKALAPFSRFIDEYNASEDLFSQESTLGAIAGYLAAVDLSAAPDWLGAKIPRAQELCAEALSVVKEGKRASQQGESILDTLLASLLDLFRAYPCLLEQVRQCHDETRKRRIIIATHMHAGDGNVHVNIPVFSSDRAMMQRASATADAIMAKVIELGGVVSGEHGIGITKMKFLEKERLEALRAYRKDVDPRGLMKPGKLDIPDIMERAFTPSFNLLELEARILQHSSLEALASSIATCIRCGKCKPVCGVFSPTNSLFFHPRNKNLAIGSLIEALLYDMQRSHTSRFNQLKYLEELADHCTLCGKCLVPCPVNIDTASVSTLERRILSERGYKHTPLQTRLSLSYLQTRNQFFNKIFRELVLKKGIAVQRAVAHIFPHMADPLRKRKLRMLELMATPMPAPSGKALRDFLPKTMPNEALLISPASLPEKTVFYFPGCGSERLYSDISLAALYILVKLGVRVVLPPANLCCGFPAKANAKTKMYDDISLRDTIILSQIREMLGHLVFDAAVVSCGTCKESLHELGVEKIFSCALTDVSCFALERAGLPCEKKDETLAYHAPCHDSLEGEGVTLLQKLARTVEKIPYCCSEAGTLALSRPDIAGAMFRRKGAAIQACTACQAKGPIITNCPSCLTGLGRHEGQAPSPMHINVYLAKRLGGPAWKNEAQRLLAQAEAVAF